MAQSANTQSQLNGLFQKVYADNVKYLVPDGVRLLKLVDFVGSSKQQGESFNMSVSIGLEHGVTYGGDSAEAFQLSGAIAGRNIQAEVKGFEMVLESVLAVGAASRAASGGKQAFEDATKYLVQKMLRSLTRRLELNLLYGQVGIAEVGGVAGQVVTIKASEWASGIWSGAENMKVEFRSPAGALRGTASVNNVDIATRQVTFDLVPATVANDDVIYFAGSYNKEAPGVHKIITNTGSLFGIDAGDYSLWKGNVFQKAAPSKLSFIDVERAVELTVEKGMESKATLLIATSSWGDLLDELLVKRQFDSSYQSGKAEVGHDSITFRAQNGLVEIVPSIHVKAGYAYLLSTSEMMRCGSTDITFDRPGREGQFFLDLPSHNGYGLRLYSDQTLFCEAPGHLAIISNIDSTAT